MSEQLKYREDIRRYLADLLGKPLEDYTDPGKKTLPTHMRYTGASGLGGDRRNEINLGMSFLSSLQARNPVTFMNAAGRQVFNNYTRDQLKQAELLQESVKLASISTTELFEENTPVSVLLIALRKHFGDEVLGWEPETVFMELEEDGVQMTERLRDKIHCGFFLSLQPDFMNDALAFENCVRALNGLSVNWSIWQKPDIAHICWGVRQGLMILSNSDQDLPSDGEFSDEVELYIATALHHDHYFMAPDILSFSQEILDKYNNNGDIVMPHLKKRWDEVSKALEKGEDLDLEEDELLDIQAGKLAGCWSYMFDKTRELESYHQTLSSIKTS